jgi:DNA end-binding protein Ku
MTRRVYIALASAIALVVAAVALRTRARRAAQDEPGQSPRPEGVVSARELDRLTRDELYARARAENVPGRSKMKKAELRDALADLSPNGR